MAAERGRALPSAVGVGVTAFLLAAVAVVEALEWEFSAIVGVPVGIVAGVFAATLVALWAPGLGRTPRAGVDAVAGFGYGVLALWLVRYVDLGGLRSTLTVDALAGGALVVAAVAGVVSWLVRPGRAD